MLRSLLRCTLPFLLALVITSGNTRISAQTGTADRIRVASVENGGLLFTDNPAGVSGTDAGYSIPMGGRTLWLFGDVFLLEPSAPSRKYVGGVSNCALLVPAGKGVGPLRQYHFLTDAKTGLARQVLPNVAGEGNETRLWPFGGWYDAARKRAYLFYGLIRATGSGGPFAFRTKGIGLARAATASAESLEFERVGSSKSGVWWPGDRLLFGAAVLPGKGEEEPYLYIVGYEERNGHKYGKMARVRRDHIEDPSAYAYYAGDAAHWSANPNEAADIEGLNDFPSELSLSYNAYLGGYLAVYSVGLEQTVRLSLAPRPWGPYAKIADIGAPHRAFEQAFCYAGKEHPELAEVGGRVIYLTYVDSQRYWLQLLKVTFHKN